MSKFTDTLNANAALHNNARILATDLVLKSVIDAMTSEQVKEVKKSLNTYIPSEANSAVSADDIELIQSLTAFFFSGKSELP